MPLQSRPLLLGTPGQLATASWQVDGGIRWVVSSNWDFVLGAFEVHKPYFNVDPNDVYRQLGTINNHGVEVSATLQAAGFKMVAGFVRNNPQVDLQANGLAATRETPVGPVPSTINLNGNFAPPQWRGWGASLQWTRLSSRVETDDDRYALPPLSTLTAGVRIARQCLTHPCSVRLDIANVTDASGLTISPQHVLLPQLRRNCTLTAAIDI